MMSEQTPEEPGVIGDMALGVPGPAVPLPDNDAEQAWEDDDDDID